MADPDEFLEQTNEVATNLLDLYLSPSTGQHFPVPTSRSGKPGVSDLSHSYPASGTRLPPGPSEAGVDVPRTLPRTEPDRRKAIRARQIADRLKTIGDSLDQRVSSDLQALVNEQLQSKSVYQIGLPAFKRMCSILLNRSSNYLSSGWQNVTLVYMSMARLVEEIRNEEKQGLGVVQGSATLSPREELLKKFVGETLQELQLDRWIEEQGGLEMLSAGEPPSTSHTSSSSVRAPLELTFDAQQSRAQLALEEKKTDRRLLQRVKYAKRQFQTSLPGVRFIFEGNLTVERSDQLQTLAWKNHGLKIHVPPGTLPDSTDTCNIHVATSFSGSFILPPNYTLVSAIYYVQPSMELLKPVTLEIEHCCSVKDESDAMVLTPIFAQCSHRSPPYTFQPFAESSSEVTSFAGRFEVSTFSLFGFVKRMTSGTKQAKEFYSCRVYYRPNFSNGWFFVRFVALPRQPDFYLIVEKRYSEKQWILMTTVDFCFSENSDVLAILFNESGITTTNGWIMKPRAVPLQIVKESILWLESPEPASCEMSVKWSRKDEEPEDLEHWVKMKGISLEKILITLNPQSGSAITDLLKSANPNQTSVTTKVVDSSNWAAICGYLHKLDRSQIQRLGGELGLSVFNLQHMQTLPDDMVIAWLRKEDDVRQQSEDPLTWKVLAEALDKIKQQGIADYIRAQECE